MNFCTKCGAKLNSDTNFCNKCGAKVISTADTGSGLSEDKLEKSRVTPPETKTPASSFSVPENKEENSDDDLKENFLRFAKALGKESSSQLDRFKAFMKNTGIPFIKEHKSASLGVAAGIIVLVVLIIVISVVSAMSPAICDYCGDEIEGKKHKLTYKDEKGTFCSDCAEIVERYSSILDAWGY